jgi:hypothetical protein
MDFPHVKITNPGMAGYNTVIELDGKDISMWVHTFEVGAHLKGVVELNLKLFCGSLELDGQVVSGVSMTEELEYLLLKQGWQPPIESAS